MNQRYHAYLIVPVYAFYLCQLGGSAIGAGGASIASMGGSNPRVFLKSTKNSSNPCGKGIVLRTASALGSRNARVVFKEALPGLLATGWGTSSGEKGQAVIVL